MFSLYTFLLILHGLNRWVALLAGVWTLAQIIPGLNGRRAFTIAERRSVTVFISASYLQVVLGLLLLAVMSLQHLPAFSGRPAIQWGHMSAGLLVVVFGLLAIVASRKATTNSTRYRAVALWSGAVLLVLGQVLVTMILLGSLFLIRLAISKLQNTRHSMTAESAERVELSENLADKKAAEHGSSI